MPLSDEQWTALARGLQRSVARVAPAWSDDNSHDPGVTVLRLLACALDDLALRNGRLSGAARALARDVVRRAAVLVGDSGEASAGGAAAPCSGELVRPRYFAGRLLSADDLRREQQYVLDRLRRRNRALHGAGIVDGLAVSVEGGDAAHVTIAPGLAFDPSGREIFVGCAQRLALPATGAALLVEMSYREVATSDAPTSATAVDADAATQPTRIVESFAAALAEEADACGVQIARLRRMRGRWRVDPAFQAAHVRR